MNLILKIEIDIENGIYFVRFYRTCPYWCQDRLGVYRATTSSINRLKQVLNNQKNIATSYYVEQTK